MTPLPDPVVAALSDPHLVALTIYGESRGEPIEGQIAVGCVLRNRYHDGRWGQSYAKVCLAPYQFSCWRPEGGKENYDRVLALATHLGTQQTIPEDPLFRQAAWVSMGIIGQWLQDIVGDATHYYSPLAMKPSGAVPKWAVNKTPVVVIAEHRFYTGIA